MFKWYEAEAIREYDDLVVSSSDFNTLANRRVDEVRRPGDKEQFRKERAAEQQRCKGAPGAPGGGLDAECQHLCQTQSEERQDYSCWCEEEIKSREGGMPSPVIYDTSSPLAGTPGAPTKQKKKISWAEYQSRPPREDPDQGHAKEEAEWHEKLKKQQEELEFWQGEVDRLKREQEELVQEQECLRAGQEQLDCLWAEQELLRREWLERRHLEEQKERQCTEQERLAAARSRMPFGSHTPVQDEHGEALDYYDDVEQNDWNQDTWQHLIADVLINKQLEQVRQATLAHDLQEAALLEGPTQTSMPTEEEVLLLGGSRWTDLNHLIQGLQGLPDSALNQLSQHIDEIRRQTPSLASPSKSPGPPPGLLDSTPQSTNMAQEILRATTHLGQLPSGDHPVTKPPGDAETRRATEFLEAQLKVPGMPLRSKELWYRIWTLTDYTGFEHSRIIQDLNIHGLFCAWTLII